MFKIVKCGSPLRKIIFTLKIKFKIFSGANHQVNLKRLKSYGFIKNETKISKFIEIILAYFMLTNS